MSLDLIAELDALLEAFERGASNMRYAAASRVSKLDPETNELLSLDLIVVGPALEEVWDGRVIVAWRKRNVSIVSREGLVAMKRLAGRPQDLPDIAVLEGNR